MCVNHNDFILRTYESLKMSKVFTETIKQFISTNIVYVSVLKILQIEHLSKMYKFSRKEATTEVSHCTI
jgi:hypothetical protein